MALSVPLSRFTPQVGGGSAFYVRPLHHTNKILHMKRPVAVAQIITTFIFAGLFTVGCGRSNPPTSNDLSSRLKAAKDVSLDKDGKTKVVKESFPDGSPKSFSRLGPNGDIIGTVYLSNGVPEHADYFDDHKRVRRTDFYRADGKFSFRREFDENGKLVAEHKLDANGEPIKTTP